MGRRLAITPEAARKRVERGVRALRARLEAKHDGDREAWLSALVAFGALPDAPTPSNLEPSSAGSGPAWLAAVIVAALVGVATLPAWTAKTRQAPVREEHARAPIQPSILATAETVDTTRQAAADAEGAGFLGLREEDGRPASGYAVLPHDGERFAEPSWSDAEGRVEWRGDAPPAALLVWRHDYALNRVDLQARGEDHVAVLPEGATLAGVLLGSERDKPCRVHLRHDQRLARIDQLGSFDPALSMADWPERQRPSAAGQALEVDAHGAFRMRGLPLGWSGTMHLGLPYTFVAGPSHGALGGDAHLMLFGAPVDLHLRTATANLLASIASLPCVRGRLARGAGLTPLASGLLSASWSCVRNSGQLPIELGADGSFWLPLVPPLASCGGTGVQLALSGHEWTRTLLASELVEGGDLGVLVVPDTDAWRFLVLDWQGRPLPDAAFEVREPNGRVRQASRTDRHGRSEHHPEQGATRLVRIAHAGHAPSHVRLGPEAPATQPSVVRLARAAELRVRAVDAGGRRLHGVLRVSAPGSTDPHRDWRDLRGVEGEALAAELRWSNGIDIGPAPSSATGGWTLVRNVARGIPLLVEWLDQEGVARASAWTSVPNDAWSSSVEIVWSGGKPRVRGRVRDHEGAAVAGALVGLGRDRIASGAEAWTGADGSFALDVAGSDGEGLALFVSKPGHAPSTIPLLDRQDADEERVIVLEPSRPLSLQVLDARLRPVERCHVSAHFPAPHGVLALVEGPRAGLHRTSDAPIGAGRARVELGGAAFEFELPGHGDPAPLVLDRIGALQCTFGPAIAGMASHPQIELQARGGAGGREVCVAIAPGADGALLPVLVHLPVGEWTISVRARSSESEPWTMLGAARALEISAGTDARVEFP
jgi:hypothetical protein